MASDPFAAPQERFAGSAAAVDSRAVFGQVMGLVAVTIAFLAAGAYLGRDIEGFGIILAFIGAFGLLLGLNVVAARNEQLAIAMLFGVGLLLGVAMGPALAYYASRDPSALWQSAGATSLFVGGFGAYGYATRRDLSSWGRTLFWLLLALIVVGLVTIFISIPGGNIIYAVLGLALFSALTIFDFNRLRRAGMESSVPIAASIFLDVVNVFQFFLMIFGGGGRR